MDISRRLPSILALVSAATCASVEAHSPFPPPGAAALSSADRAPVLFRSVPQFAPLPGKVVGVIVLDAQDAFAAEERFGPAGASGFASGVGSYRWFYVAAEDPGKGDDLTVNVGSPKDAVADFSGVVPATRRTLPRAIREGVCRLAEVEVNGGKGSPADEVFVATRIVPLDRSPEYPLDLSEVVARARTDWAARFHPDSEGVARSLEEARRAALGDAKPTGPLETLREIRVTWLPRERKILLELRTTVANGRYAFGKGTAPSDAAPGSKPDDRGRRYGTSYGVRRTEVLEISPRGEILSRSSTPISLWKETIPPPNQAGPGIR
ncbi:MAG: hypothetical protein SFX72_09635 [Isosphaeraceae bacterium]|nr:hypothetical protein [Isosphaeraceae bacterium]